MRNLPAGVALLAGLASSATTGSFCSSASSCGKSATGFCSSYLNVPAKTSTITSTATVVSTRTATVSSGVTTATVTSGTATTTATATVPDFVGYTTTTTVSSTYTTTSSTYSYQGGCKFTGTNPNIQKRAATATRPACLSAYPSGTALSSACSCFSIPPSTSTVTETTTSTSFVTRTATTSKVRNTSTVTRTVLSTSTITYTSTQQPTTTVYVTSENSDWYLQSGTSGPLDQIVVQEMTVIGLAFDQPYAPHADPLYLHTYDGVDCVLSAGGGAPYAFIYEGEETISFSNTPPVGQLLRCRHQPFTRQLFCRHPNGRSYNAGFLDADSYWHIPVDASMADARILTPDLS